MAASSAYPVTNSTGRSGRCWRASPASRRPFMPGRPTSVMRRSRTTMSGEPLSHSPGQTPPHPRSQVLPRPRRPVVERTDRPPRKGSCDPPPPARSAATSALIGPTASSAEGRNCPGSGRRIAQKRRSLREVRPSLTTISPLRSKPVRRLAGLLLRTWQVKAFGHPCPPNRPNHWSRTRPGGRVSFKPARAGASVLFQGAT